MSPLTFVFVVLGTAALLAFVIVTLRFNLKRLRIARCARRATQEQLEHIYALVERTGTEPSNGYILARTNRTTGDSSCVIPLPDDLPDFPWGGCTVTVNTARRVEFRFVNSTTLEPSFLGQIYRLVRIPRSKQKRSGKLRNTFMPERYVANSAPLLAALSQVCTTYPRELLAYLLCVGRDSFEFEPSDQARIGASPAWVQNLECQSCDICHKRMVLVVQLPGAILGNKALREGTVYLFGCSAHPDQTKIVEQFT